MAILVKQDGEWVDATPVAKDSGSIKEAEDVYLKRNGVWVSLLSELGFTGFQIGDAILTGNTTWEDSTGTVRYSLLDTNTSFSATDYPLLAEIYTSLVTPDLTTPDGSIYNYKIVADLQS